MADQGRAPLSCLITGVAGMLGHALAAHLAARGHRVAGCDVKAPQMPLEGVATAVADVRDSAALDQLFAALGPVDVVIHAGGVSGSMVLRDAPAEIFAINVTGTVNLLEAMRRAGTRRLVQCSSIMAYGPTGAAQVDEDAPLQPANAYGASKVASEALIRAYVAEFGLAASSLRLAHVYGPARRTYCPVRTLVAAALKGEPAVLSDTPQATRQFVHSDDVVRALECAVVDGRPGLRVANIGPGAERRLTEVAALVRQEIGPVEAVFRDGGAGDYDTGVLKIARAKDYWGWAPQVDLSAGIASVAADVRAAA